jgi:hypothetical protein
MLQRLCEDAITVVYAVYKLHATPTQYVSWASQYSRVGQGLYSLETICHNAFHVQEVLKDLLEV